MEEVAQHVLVLPQREVVPMAKKNKKGTSANISTKTQVGGDRNEHIRVQ